MGKSHHIVPNDGNWPISGGGNVRATSIHGIQKAAIDAGREIARIQELELVIHRLDGRIREKDSYSNDPFPPKDKIH